MKLANSNLYRSETIAELLKYFSDKGEDCGMVASNSFNLPIVVNGDEGWVEIVVKVTKYDDNEGYMKRVDYTNSIEEKKIKAEENAKKKAEKIAKDNAKREEKARARANA